MLRMPRNTMCPRHIKTLPHQLNNFTGVCVVQITLFQAACEDERVAKRCGYQPATETAPEVLARSEDLELILAEVAPLCCFVAAPVYQLVLKWAQKVVREKKPVNHDEFLALLRSQ